MRLRSVLLALLPCFVSLAVADQRMFVSTYDWFTPGRHERETEITYDMLRDHTGFAQLEFEYGVTDRWLIAPYILFSSEGGREKFAGLQLEQRYRFGDFHYGRLLPAVYFEVHKENTSPYELEGKLIETYMPNANWIVSGNLILEHRLETGARAEVGYSIGVSRIYRTFNIGFEAKGNFLDNEHLIGPTVGFNINPSSKLLFGAGLAVGHDTVSRLRVLFEKEF